jgi:DNA repair protein SbcD/Mre11
MPFRFVHTADIHLDSPLRTLALRNPELAELIGSATRRAFTAIVDLCLDERVDALLLSGDLYDGEQTSMKTARFLAGELRRLHEGGVRTFVVRGNHDALSRITRELILPPSVKVFGGRAETVAVDAAGLDILIHGLSFSQPQAPDSLLPKYRPPQAGAVNIALMHTSLAGAAGHDVYAPCSPADLFSAGFDYWALGHVHKRGIPKTGEGGRAVVMPGMPQGRDINEGGRKSATLVTVSDDRSIAIEERFTSVAEFTRVDVDLFGAAEWPDAVASIARALEAARERAGSEHLVARLVLTGETPLAWALRRDADLVRAEAEQAALAAGRSWIDKVEIAARPQTAAASAPAAAHADPLSELRALLARQIAGSPELQQQAAAIADELRSQLPPECRHILGRSEDEAQAILRALVAEGSQDVLARLDGRARAPERA